MIYLQHVNNESPQFPFPFMRAGCTKISVSYLIFVARLATIQILSDIVSQRENNWNTQTAKQYFIIPLALIN